MKKGNLYFLFPVFVACMAILASCIGPTKTISVLDKQPDLFSKNYSSQNIAIIKQGFKQNPIKFSDQMGKLVLWQFHQKDPELGIQFAKLPDLNDKMNPKEVEALISAYDMISPIKLIPGLFDQKEEDLSVNAIELVFKNEGDKEFKHIGNIEFAAGYYASNGQFKSFNIKNTESNDVFKKEGFGHYGTIKWDTITEPGDTDVLKISLIYAGLLPTYIYSSGKKASFTQTELAEKAPILLKYGNASLLIRPTSKSDLPQELFAIKDMVKAGSGSYRYSAPLEALLWGYIDGKFKKSDNIFNNYTDHVSFTMLIWGDMKGERWQDFSKTSSRFNTLQLIHHITKVKISYDFYRGSRKTKNMVFEERSANCVDTSNFVDYHLKKIGYKSSTLNVEGTLTDFHTINIFWKNGSLYVINNGTPGPGGIKGPYKSVYDIPFSPAF